MQIPREWTVFTDFMTQGHFVTDDGVDLHYQCFGEGPTVLFANGIGVRFPGAHRQIEALRDRYRIICWDYRGMGQSTMLDPALADLTMPRHGRDALALLDHLGVEKAIFIGWSMGVQVSLEAIRRAPSKVIGLVAISGTYGQPFRTGLPSIAGHLVEGFFALLAKSPRVAQGALDLAVALPDPVFYLLTRAAFVGSDVDRLVFDANVLSVARVEKSLYLRTMLALARHDASDVLPHLACPTLVICAERDYFTPPKVAREMARRIPGAEFKEVMGGSHFALIEQAGLVNQWLREFVDRVFGARAAG